MKKDAKLSNSALWSGRVLYLIYVAGLCYCLFFADGWGRIFGQENYRYNLIPFREIERFWTYRHELGIRSFFNLAGNILGFVPAGFFIPILWKKKPKFWYTMFITLNMSFQVEILQLICKVGSFDIDDMILNTIGGMLGYLLLRAVVKWRDHEKT